MGPKDVAQKEHVSPPRASQCGGGDFSRAATRNAMDDGFERALECGTGCLLPWRDTSAARSVSDSLLSSPRNRAYN